MISGPCRVFRCTESAAVDAGAGVSLCAAHALTHLAFECPSCHATVVSARDAAICGHCASSAELFAALPVAMREALVRAGPALPGILAILEIQPTYGLGRAMDFAAWVSREQKIPHRPPVPPVAALIEALAARSPVPAAIEALWDGDSHGWMVLLVAIHVAPSGALEERPIVTVANQEGDFRLFAGTAPPWPEAAQAAQLGAAIATHFGIPFHFGSPEAPSLDAPRWHP